MENGWHCSADELPNCESIVWVWSEWTCNFDFGYYDQIRRNFINPVRNEILLEITYWKHLPFHYLNSPYQGE
jgi:hypothetical protein